MPEPDPIAARQKVAAAGVRGELPSAFHPPSGCRFRTRCSRAEERCALEEPPLLSFGAGHVAACHFPLETPITLSASCSALTSAPDVPGGRTVPSVD